MTASIHSCPLATNEEEVDLPDDDVAFSLRSMFTEAGGLGTSSSQAEASVAMDHAASRQYNDEAYARELDNKLEKKEIDADTVVEDPLAVAEQVNQKDNMSSMASGGSHMLVVEDLRTMEPVRVCSPTALGTEGSDGSRKRGAPRDTGVAGKKVKFLSEIMTQVYPRDNEDASAEEAVMDIKQKCRGCFPGNGIAIHIHTQFGSDFRLGAELMEAERASDLDFDYIATMITEEHTGVRIEAAKKIMLLLKHMDSWAVYAIDMEKKICMVLDPVETEEPGMRWRPSTKGMRPGCCLTCADAYMNASRASRYHLHVLSEVEVSALSDSQMKFMAKSIVYQTGYHACRRTGQSCRTASWAKR